MGSLLLALAATAAASSFPVDYSLNLASGTLNGNSLTSILVMESNGSSINLDFPFTLPGSGISNLSHTAPFVPTFSLIVGLDLPSTTGGDNKTHLVFFTNDAFAQSAVGIPFSTVFSHTRHNNFISRLLLGEAGDATQIQWLKDFFLGDGLAAAFPTGSNPTAVEFTSGLLLTPEPVSVGFVGFGLAALIAARRKK